MCIKIYLRKAKIICAYMLFILVFVCAFYLSIKNRCVNAESLDVELPIIMYHSLSDDQRYKSRYVISPTLFESDLRYIRDKGYTPIFINDLIKYVYGEDLLPQKPIILTFDDGYYNNFLYAYKYALKYSCKIVISPIVKCTEQYSSINDKEEGYAHLTWDDIKTMVDSKIVEIGNHSYNLHSIKGKRRGATTFKGESPEHYKSMLKEDVLMAQEKIKEHTGAYPNVFVYPFGAVGKSSDKILEQLGFKCTLGCTSKMNKIVKDFKCLYGMGRFIRPPGVPSDRYFKEILK